MESVKGNSFIDKQIDITSLMAIKVKYTTLFYLCNCSLKMEVNRMCYICTILLTILLITSVTGYTCKTFYDTHRHACMHTHILSIYIEREIQMLLE